MTEKIELSVGDVVKGDGDSNFREGERAVVIQVDPSVNVSKISEENGEDGREHLTFAIGTITGKVTVLERWPLEAVIDGMARGISGWHIPKDLIHRDLHEQMSKGPVTYAYEA